MNNYETARQAFLKGVECLEKQEFTNAERLFTETLKHAPRSIPTLINLAIVQCRQERFDEADETARKAITIDPNNLDAYSILSTCQKAKGQYEDVVKTCDKMISIDPKNADSYSNRGFALAAIGRHKEAIESYDRAIAIQPHLADAFVNRGNSLKNLERHDEAFVAYDKALALKPDLAEAWLGCGRVSFDLKRYDDALAAYDKAVALKPDLAEAWLGRGNVCLELKRNDDALVAYDKAVALKSDLAGAWLGRGNIFTELKRYEEAFAAYDKALALKPDLAGAWLGRGNVYADLKRYDEAFAAYDKALSIKPDLAAVYTSRAWTLHILMRNNEALNSLDRAIELDPIEAQAHFNRGLVLLTLGDYAEAWEECEWRKKLPRRHGNRTFAQPALSSLESIKGATVFLYGEQGLGDHIHFCRYAKLVADKGAKVVLEAPKPLFHSFKSLDGISQLIEVGQSVPPFDYHCSLMSLPRAFRTTLDNVPNKVPYLFAEPNKINAWANKLGAKSKLRIGLVWSGGFRPNQPEVWATNQRRNMPLAQFGPLRVLDADFYSLQKGEPAVSELKESLGSGWNGPAIIDWTDELNDFSDTAALIENLDLIISVDTSTAHLAGAMAKPVWLLNRFDIEWRWLPNSPWYPTIKLYRQKEADNWDDVIENVKTDLISTLHGAKRRP